MNFEEFSCPEFERFMDTAWEDKSIGLKLIYLQVIDKSLYVAEFHQDEEDRQE